MGRSSVEANPPGGDEIGQVAVAESANPDMVVVVSNRRYHPVIREYSGKKPIRVDSSTIAVDENLVEADQSD